jgi:hypothetical protein
MAGKYRGVEVIELSGESYKVSFTAYGVEPDPSTGDFHPSIEIDEPKVAGYAEYPDEVGEHLGLIPIGTDVDLTLEQERELAESVVFMTKEDFEPDHGDWS